MELAEDVTLEAGVILRGTTRVGRDTVIRAGSYLVDSVVGERCTIWASVLESADRGRRRARRPVRAPAARRTCRRRGGGGQLRGDQGRPPWAPGSKQHHFSYLGDAEIGEGVNIGAGTITANYDGRRKHRTVIGDDAFIGSDTILRAPDEHR